MKKAPEKQNWDRREFLTGAGATIGLPFFASLFPKAAWADRVTPPARMIFMSVPYGFVPNSSLISWVGGKWGNLDEGVYRSAKGWFPEQDGAEYTLPEVHADLEPFRKHFSFIKGLANRKYRGGIHESDDVWLTCADTFADPSRTFSNTISCDQVAAASEALAGEKVRVPTLPLGIPAYYTRHGGGLSYTAQGLPVTPMESPANVFDLLFGKDDLPAHERLRRLKAQKSVLDVTLGQIKDLNRKLNAADRRKLDEVVSAVRGVEAGIQREERWIDVPKPKPKTGLERPDPGIGTKSAAHTRAMFDLIHAAFLTDSTRVVTYHLPEVFTEVTPFDKHALNHSSGLTQQMADAVRMDKAVSEQVAHLVKLLWDSKEHDGQALLHHTVAAFGAAFWGTHHWNFSLPMMLIGHGGGKVKQGLTHTCKTATPLANLWLTMLRVCGVPLNSFADSTGVLDFLTA